MAEHEHKWVQIGGSASADVRCACGASLGAIENVLDDAAADARQIAGDSYYTGCRICSESEVVELWLFDAPSELVGRLETLRPGIYVIHNDAPRPQRVLDDLRDSFDWPTRKSEGIEVVTVGPTVDGYLRVGVVNDVEGAQSKLDAIYGDDVVRVCQQARPIRTPARGS